MSNRILALVRFAGLALLLVASVSARAQFNASLSGTVQDSTQAVIPGATVVLTNDATQATQTAISSDAGTYQFNELPPGNYTLKASAKGFQQNTVSNIAVVAETPRNLDLTMSQGQETQTVNVNADLVPLLQTSDASIGSTVTAEQIQRLPTFGADPYELLRTAPGITGDGARSGTGAAILLPNGAGPGGSNSGIFQTENQVQISSNGQRVEDNTYTLDGVSVDSLTHGGSAVVTPNEEAVSQITMVTTSYDAGDGRNTGAQIKAVTKSGTNQLHGSLFFLYDEPGLNAFNKYGGPAPGTLRVKDVNKQRTWAASLGGPIVNDKLFFFTSFEEFKESSNSSTSSYVETPQFRSAIQAQRPGGISESMVADPNSQPRIVAVLPSSCAGFTVGVTCNVVTGGIDIGSLFPGGASQIGSYLSSSTSPAYPAPYNTVSPQQVGGGLDGVPDLYNVQLVVPSRSRGNQYNARIDWQASPKDLFAGSVFFTKLDNVGTSGTAGSRPDTDLPFKPLNSAEAIIWIHTFSASWLNEARINGTRFAENGVKDAGSTVNFGVPYDNVQNYPTPLQYGVNQASTSPAIFAENTYEARDTVTDTFGSHTIRVGVEARIEQDNDNLSGDQRPVYAFNGIWQFANDAPVFEQVQASAATGGVPLTARYFRSQDFALFVQHDWKVTSNFTFNAGLRWELFTPLRNNGFEVNEPELGPAGHELAGTTLTPVDYMWHFQPRNFGPRIGFAWSPNMFHNKTVIRGGYALAYNHLDTALFNNEVQDGPNNFLYYLCCGGNNPAGAVPAPLSTHITGAATAGILYEKGTTNSPASFPVNPTLANGTGANGFPNSYTFPGTTQSISPSVELYGADPNLKYPSSDLYSLEVQTDLGYKFTGTLGYAGSTGRHYARLVDQDFLYTTSGAPFGDFFRAQTDSVQNYNAFNAQLRRTGRYLTVSAVYSFAKSLDQLSNGDGSDSNANQTNPANNASEYGPSDYNLKHRIVATALYQTPSLHTNNALIAAVVNGWQINGTYTYHTGFPWTPVTGNISSQPAVAGAGTINPARPVSYNGQAGSSCSTNAFETGSNFPNRPTPGGGYYFGTTPPPSGAYVPGIGRNSFQGPCYQDVDMSVAKEIAHDFGDRHTLLRFQANMFNAFNILQLQPLTNGNANGGSNIGNQYFGYSQGADSGRVIEFLARIQF